MKRILSIVLLALVLAACGTRAFAGVVTAKAHPKNDTYVIFVEYISTRTAKDFPVDASTYELFQVGDHVVTEVDDFNNLVNIRKSE